MNYLLVAWATLFILPFTVGDHHTVKICTGDVTKCKSAMIANFTCVKSDDCTKAAIDGTVDLAFLSANSMAKNGNKLKVVYGVKVINVSENFVQYYGLAVVKKGTPFNLKQLKGKDSCHTGVGRTVGWRIPVGYLLYKKEMNFTCDQYQSVAEFFDKSCAPGARDVKGISDAIKNDLCNLCNGTCATSSSKEPYYSYEGAFKCMAEGNNDRVGFVKETTADAVLADYPKYGSKADYELLCKNGTKTGLDQYKTCNIDKRPASAFVTKAGASAATVSKIKSILDNVDLADLITGKIVSDNIEKLVSREATAEDYVGEYGKHYNALTEGEKCPVASASSTFVSFSLLVIAIFAFLQLA